MENVLKWCNKHQIDDGCQRLKEMGKLPKTVVTTSQNQTLLDELIAVGLVDADSIPVNGGAILRSRIAERIKSAMRGEITKWNRIWKEWFDQDRHSHRTLLVNAIVDDLLRGNL